MIFDVDVLIWALQGNLLAARTVDGAVDRALSVISFMERLQGTRSKLELRQIRQSLQKLRFRILPVSESISARAVALIEQHALADGIQVADALIATTAIDSG